VGGPFASRSDVVLHLGRSADDDQDGRTSAADLPGVVLYRIPVDPGSHDRVGRFGTRGGLPSQGQRFRNSDDAFVGLQLLVFCVEVPVNSEINVSTPENGQSCSAAGLYRIWIAYGAGLAIFAWIGNWPAMFLWSVLVPLGKLLQLRFFPHFSILLGYGRIARDVLPTSTGTVPVAVTYYSAIGCPFCPIVLSRLEALRAVMHFHLEKVNVSLHPGLAASKGIRSVPTVEVGGNRLVGNVTSEQLARLIGRREGSLAAS
jgi:hypothetical protein